MKQLSVIPFLLALTTSYYSSNEQALEACMKWSEEGESISWQSVTNVPKRMTFVDEISYNRKCKMYGEDTGEWIGIEGEFSDEDRRREGMHLTARDRPMARSHEAVKVFRYRPGPRSYFFRSEIEGR